MDDCYIALYKIYVQLDSAKLPKRMYVTKIPIRGESVGLVIGIGRKKTVKYLTCKAINPTIDEKDNVYHLVIDDGNSFNVDTGRGFNAK